MKADIWRIRGRCWAGAGCAALWSWLALAANLWVALLPLAMPWGVWFSVLYGLLAFLSIFYGAGIVATFFWHGVASSKKCADWGAWTALLILAPLLALSLLNLLAIIFLMPFAILPLLQGVEWGEDCWKRRRWRHLFGLSNDWERDEMER